MEHLEAALASFYDQEAAGRARRQCDPVRSARRDEFVALLRAEQRRRLLEVGTGPGRDATAFLADGLRVSGVDLSAEHVRLARAAGVDAHRASLFDLPFPTRSFDAGWCMSTLLHVPDARIDEALAGIGARLLTGAPLAVGLWGGPDWEGLSTRDTITPPRFFSIRSDDRVRALLGGLGPVERFETWPHPAGAGAWHYQWAVVRIS